MSQKHTCWKSEEEKISLNKTKRKREDKEDDPNNAQKNTVAKKGRSESLRKIRRKIESEEDKKAHRKKIYLKAHIPSPKRTSQQL